MDHNQPKRVVLGVLNFVLAKHSASCVGFVLMPDHVHALVWFPEPDQLSRFIHEWKRQSSLKIRAWYRQQAPNYSSAFGEGEKFWQPKYYSFSIYDRRKLEEKLQYIHLNPVRAGLVGSSVEWHWSSARWYERQQSVEVPIQWVD